MDYNLVDIKVKQVSGTKHLRDYIITTDASKHIAMMSQGAKAKEVRDYVTLTQKRECQILSLFNDVLENAFYP